MTEERRHYSSSIGSGLPGDRIDHLKISEQIWAYLRQSGSILHNTLGVRSPYNAPTEKMCALALLLLNAGALVVKANREWDCRIKVFGASTKP